MTFALSIKPPKSEVIGAYSLWPRRQKTRRAPLKLAALVAGAGVFFHCIVPMMFGA